MPEKPSARQELVREKPSTRQEPVLEKLHSESRVREKLPQDGTGHWGSHKGRQDLAAGEVVRSAGTLLVSTVGLGKKPPPPVCLCWPQFMCPLAKKNCVKGLALLSQSRQ